MHGQLVCDRVNINDRAVVSAILRTAMLELRQPSNWHTLSVHGVDQFRTSVTEPPAAPGWYIITELSTTPLYVGEAENLDRRLNSATGSLDNFNNSKRMSDPVRNFLKYFVLTGILEGLRVGVVREAAVLAALALDLELSKHDRCNIEKLLGIFRVGLVPQQPAKPTGG